MGLFGKKMVVIEENVEIHDGKEDKKGAMDDVDPKVGGKLGIVAFGTTATWRTLRSLE